MSSSRIVDGCSRADCGELEILEDNFNIFHHDLAVSLTRSALG